MSTGTPATRYDKWLLKTMNDTRTKRYHATRAARRRIIAAHMAATVVGVAALVTGYAREDLWPLVWMLVALVAWIPLTGLLNSMTYGLLDLRTRVLDERQIAERGAVHAVAYRVTSWMMALTLLGFYAAWTLDVPLSDLAVPLASAGLSVFVLHRLLPLWIAALRAQDPPEEEPDEAAGGPAPSV
ncbi:hypothetical protein FM076_20690 [Streptomyces albus subsp. chlorinus]|uniref:hypothetical protein n=1 Tax=Streptomyces albus TaxID=1888 RepID=UPI00156DB491|nr:hypothetical protein [Streptomyces albus]NSC23437.1 hypothetical protein [Streptomyces albus subsp. chlorinus]